MPGPTEWILIGVVVLVLFGAKKIPELARSLGRSSTEFKKGVREGAFDPDDAAPDQAHPAE
jgi:sec-independent protein translocase protein TatA